MELEIKKDKSTHGTAVKLTPLTYKYIKQIKEKTGANNSYIVWNAIRSTYKDILKEE